MAGTPDRNAGVPGSVTTDCGTMSRDQERTSDQITVTFTTVSGDEMAKHIFCKGATVQAFNATLRDKGYVLPAGTKYCRAHVTRVLAPLSDADRKARVFADVQTDCEQTWVVILQAGENAAAAACRGGTLQDRVMTLHDFAGGDFAGRYS